jgi:hypothetical protein
MNEELAKVLRYMKEQSCEGFCRDLPSADFYNPEMDIDCFGCRARAVLAKYEATVNPAASPDQQPSHCSKP